MRDCDWRNLEFFGEGGERASARGAAFVIRDSFGNENGPHGDSWLGVDGLYPPDQRCSDPRRTYALVPVRGTGSPDPLGARLSRARCEGTERVAYHAAHRAADNCDYCFASLADPAMDGILSMAMSPVVGDFLLFLGHQLLDCGLRRRCTTPSLARIGSG